MWLQELEDRAAEVLPWYVREYVAATAGDAASRDAALAEWDALRFRPYALRGPRDLDVTTTVLGREVRTPILVAPMAQQVAAHPRGEAATAEGVREAGSLLGVSTNTAIRFDEIAAAGAPWWFQLYLLSDPGATRALVDRAVAAGADAIVLTVDTTALLASRPGIEPTDWPAGPARARLGNLEPHERAALRGTPGPSPELEDIARLAESTGLPIVVKGVLRADDARAAVEAGASGIVVSTHGGRRMGGSISSLAALPEIAAAVGDDCELYLDSGIRSGGHALAALALGARAVFVGRPVYWGLAAEGPDGVQAVLARLTAQLRTALDQSGARSLAELSPELLA